jgi:hypothetical protein
LTAAAFYDAGVCHQSVTTEVEPHLELENVLHVDTLTKIVSKDSGRTTERAYIPNMLLEFIHRIEIWHLYEPGCQIQICFFFFRGGGGELA